VFCSTIHNTSSNEHSFFSGVKDEVRYKKIFLAITVGVGPRGVGRPLLDASEPEVLFSTLSDLLLKSISFNQNGGKKSVVYSCPLQICVA
jgi:hypothetical protein